jgi:hypothetical protein
VGSSFDTQSEMDKCVPILLDSYGDSNEAISDLLLSIAKVAEEQFGLFSLQRSVKSVLENFSVDVPAGFFHIKNLKPI